VCWVLQKHDQSAELYKILAVTKIYICHTFKNPFDIPIVTGDPYPGGSVDVDKPPSLRKGMQHAFIRKIL